MVNFNPSVPPAVASKFNAIVNAAKSLPVLPTLVGFFYKNVLATPVQGLACLLGKATRPANSDLKAAALTYAAIFALNYARKTEAGKTATNFVSTNVGIITGHTKRVENANNAVKEAIKTVNVQAKALADFKANHKGLFEAAEKAATEFKAAKKEDANYGDLKAESEGLANQAKEPREQLAGLTKELADAVKALTAAKGNSFFTYVTAANKKDAESALDAAAKV